MAIILNDSLLQLFHKNIFGEVQKIWCIENVLSNIDAHVLKIFFSIKPYHIKWTLNWAKNIIYLGNTSG